MTYVISIATEEDADNIAKIAKQSGELHQHKEPSVFKKCKIDNDADYIKKAIKDEYAEVFKASCKDKIIGYLVLYIHDCPKEFFVYPEYGYIGDLGVSKDYRNQGVAQLLVSEAESYLLSKNIKSVELDVFLFNDPANNLYTKMGYKNLKYRKRKLL